MSNSLLIVGASQIATPKGKKAARGKDLSAIHVTTNAVVRCDSGKITFVGSLDEHNSKFPKPEEVLDASGGCILPGFVDPHTHLVWSGSREEEFNRRLRGESYMDIAKSGGGINSTVRSTRRATLEELVESALSRLDLMLLHGTTTAEAKSGYGLDLETEVRQLEAIKRLNHLHPIELHPTCLAAHEVPPEFRGKTDEYVNFVLNEVYPKVAELGLAEAVDVFCEAGVFDVQQTRLLLRDAARYGWGIHLHADEIEQLGGTELAVELGALSADHLVRVSERGVKMLANSDTVAVLLPGTSFFLRSDYAPARSMIEEGCAVALATDLNPGSSPTESMPMILSLASLAMGMLVEEAITAATLNAAAALGLADKLGTVEVGKQADLIILREPTYFHLVYHYGVNPVKHVIKAGQVVVKDGEKV